MFSLLNNGTRVGNYSSPVCNFLSFSTSAGSQRLLDSLDALYVIDRRAVTKPVKMDIGLRIAHPYERPIPVRVQTREN